MSKINNKTIKDYLLGKTTAKEMEQLAEWLAVSEENRKEFFELELAFHLGKNNQAATSKKIEEAETKLFNQIKDYEEQKEYKGNIHFFRYAAAIVVAVLLAGGGLFAYLYQSAEMITVAALNEVKKVVLPDNSTVWLNKGATISYADNFEGNERKVNLKGEALFKVTKNAEKPFIVSSDGASAKVLGTTFNFKDQAANGKEVISLIEGRLEVTGLNGEGKVILQPNQKATVSKDSKTIRKENSYTPVDAVWHDNMIPFSNMQIKEIAHILEQFYDYKIIVDSKLDNKRTYTGVIERKKDIRNVLDGLAYTISFHYTINNKEVTLSK